MDYFEALYRDIRRGKSIIEVCREYGGLQIYIPYPNRYIKKQIKKEFTGANHRELAKKYGVSVRQVYRILKEGMRDEKKRDHI